MTLKPRLRLYDGLWYCTSPRGGGIGYSAKLAYLRWQYFAGLRSELP